MLLLTSVARRAGLARISLVSGAKKTQAQGKPAIQARLRSASRPRSPHDHPRRHRPRRRMAASLIAVSRTVVRDVPALTSRSRALSWVGRVRSWELAKAQSP
jgi:hypothetical protein